MASSPEEKAGKTPTLPVLPRAISTIQILKLTPLNHGGDHHRLGRDRTAQLPRLTSATQPAWWSFSQFLVNQCLSLSLVRPPDFYLPCLSWHAAPPSLEWNGPRSPCRLNPTRHWMTLKPNSLPVYVSGYLFSASCIHPHLSKYYSTTRLAFENLWIYFFSSYYCLHFPSQLYLV
ncbi:hypothetical protein PpBr36_01729 [Pyricularia pennisetigena]|uniref:hypothetical protein n=1 Tax=Pyricularia pennisetigena TaxID=1578925 RepID=UPI001151419A|nr:hypothetical protein PpBr36_01729 [Pyricularia pennisetigena]TLS27973.1 hypothetical protein PpBr36_01729 [Pyricularia pennisetigena]